MYPLKINILRPDIHIQILQIISIHFFIFSWKIFVTRSKYFLLDDHFISCPNLFSILCIDVVGRKLILTTLRLCVTHYLIENQHLFSYSRSLTIIPRARVGSESIGSFQQRRRRWQRGCQKSNRLFTQNNNFARASCFLVHFFTVLARI